MAKQIYLALALHNHQPVGNFPSVFEQAYQEAYEPLIELLEVHPRVPITLHYTGPLIDWLKIKHPEFFGRVASLVRRGQVEIMTGGYYEPILPSIPDVDKHGQIRKMTESVGALFGYNPVGLWLAERVWEPTLPKHLVEAGVRYTVLDDQHFKMAGLEDSDLFGYYLTEELGHKVRVFGTSMRLRYGIPWWPVEKTIAFLAEEATENGHRLAMMGDDGEKFGSWPLTYDLVYRQGWMEKFFRALEDNSDWLKCITLAEYADRFPPIGQVYLPTASYSEMMQWALPANAGVEFKKIGDQLERENNQSVLRFLRGGFWRNFLVKYPEVNAMHKKMLHVHQKVYGALGTMTGVGIDAEDRNRALDELWQGQCNCPYWHGVFGGIYLSDIRSANYRHLIAAEKIADRWLHPAGTWLEYRWLDFDCDGLEEVLVESDRQSLYFDLAEGGSLFEWDDRQADHNLTTVLSRRKEAYHEELLAAQRAHRAEDTGDEVADDSSVWHGEDRRKGDHRLEEYLHYDWYRRACLLDHCLVPGTTLERFANADFGELGDFVNQPYEAVIEPAGNQLSIILSRDGHIWQGPDFLPMRIEKRLGIVAGQAGFTVDINLTNSGTKPLQFEYGNEWNFNLLAGGHNDNAYFELPGLELDDWHGDTPGEELNVEQVYCGNRWLNVRLGLGSSKPATFWRFPVEAVARSEGGFGLVYEGSCLLFHWPVYLMPGQGWRVRLTVELSSS